MQKQIYVATMLAASVFLAACDDGADGANGVNGAPGIDGLNSLVVARNVPVGDAVCLGGGFAFDTGLDFNRNNVLDADEVLNTEYSECAVTPTLRALHASADAPAVNILIDGVEALSGVDFAEGSGFVGVGLAANVTANGADVDVTVDAILPGGSTVAAIDATLALEFGTETSVIAAGDVADGLPLTPIVVSNPAGAGIAAGNFRAQIVHAAPDAPPVDVYVTAFDAPLATPVNALPLAFGEYTGQLEVPEGDYQIRVAVPGTPPTVVYDSGEVSLAAGADLLIVAVPNAGLGESAVQLVVMDGTTAAPLYDVDTGAAAIAVHLSPDAGNVDVLADIDATATIENLVLAEDIGFGAACFIGGIPAPVDFTLSVAATGTTTSALDIPFSSAVNEAATVIVGGYALGGEPALQAIALATNGRSVATEARIRLVHASASTGNVDIYLLPTGVDINAATPDFADVPFGADTGMLTIDPSTSNDVYVTAAGSKTPAIAVQGFVATAGAILDIVARDQADGLALDPAPLIVSYDDTLADCPTP